MKPIPSNDTWNDEDFPYRFSYGDPGMFLELYVPTSYECEMRRVLELGADIRAVKDYLIDNMNEITKLLAANVELTEKFDKARVEKFDNILEGFSIYGGDGAFFEDKENGKVHIHKERVSVVRLMFMAPLEKWIRAIHNKVKAEILTREQLEELKHARFAARQFLRFWTHNESKYIEYRNTCIAPLEKGVSETKERDKSFASLDDWELALIGKLKVWLDDIALLVNGYVIHQLCRETMRRFNAGLAPNREVEIWLGSFRSLAVNRVMDTSKKEKEESPEKSQ